ncbi:MAG: glycosyltransferase family 4 protein, partial [Armatimonadetes bacterium]|nr:glycosyltransferase family 4 protein [Armatimonadota bacterium]
MRILVCNYEYPPLGGGGAPVAADIVDGLADRGHELDVVTMGFRGLPAREEPRPGVRIFRVPCWRRHRHMCSTKEMATYVLPALLRALALHRCHPYDVCHCHFIFPSGVVAWILNRLTSLPYVVTPHGSDVPGFNPDRFGIEHVLLRPLWLAVVRKAAAFTFATSFLRDLFLRAAPGAWRIEIIPHPISVAEFPQTSHQQRVLFTGRLLPRKGAQVLLEALEDVEMPGWEVHIVGDGPMRAEVEERAQRMRIPTFVHGWLDRGSETMRELWETASILAFPSLRESPSMTVLEAMASGMAVVAVRAGGTPEAVGDAGILVEPGDLAGLREAVVGLMADERRRRELGAAARQRVQQMCA